MLDVVPPVLDLLVPLAMDLLVRLDHVLRLDAGPLRLELVPLQLDLVTENPVLFMLIALMLLFVFGVYLMFRRTLLAFTEGMRSGKDR